MTQDIVTNCLLCGEHGLHLIGEGREQMHQCLNENYNHVMTKKMYIQMQIL